MQDDTLVETIETIEEAAATNSIYDWLLSLAVLVIVYLSLQLVKWIIRRRASKIAAKGQKPKYETLSRLVHQTSVFFILVMAIYAGSLSLTLPTQVNNLLRVAVILGVLFQVGLWASTLIDLSLARRTRQELADEAGSAITLNIMGLIAKVALWAVVLLLMLESIPGVQVNTLIASLGIAGIAVGLAVQNILSDLFSSLSIALDKPFVIGDFIVVGEFRGNVEYVGLKSTRIRSLSGEQIVFSNSDLLGSRIQNLKRMERRRVAFSIGVTYQTSPDKLSAIPGMLRSIVEKRDLVTFDRAHFKEFGDFALIFEVVYFLETPDYLAYMDTQQAINLDIYRCLAEEEIEFAYPTQTLFLERQAAQVNGGDPDPRPEM
jgi:small-conductance mechanosensitive channel